jgi:hypothetical protein
VVAEECGHSGGADLVGWSGVDRFPEEGDAVHDRLSSSFYESVGIEEDDTTSA